MIDLCDTVGWLDHGRLMTVGEPADVVAAYLAKVSEVGDNKLTTRD